MDLIYSDLHRNIGQGVGLPWVRIFRVFHFAEGISDVAKIVHKTRWS